MTAPVLTGTGAAHVTGTGAGFAPHRGDDRIPTCVEIGYGGAWHDVTSAVRSLTTRRGRSEELQRFEAGTLTMTLDNRTGAYSVWAGSGTAVGCPIRVRISAEKSDPTGASPGVATYDPVDGGFYYAWSGFIESLDYDWSDGGMTDAWCVVTASDAFALLNRADLIAATFPTGGSATGVANPVEVPQRHDYNNVAVPFGFAVLVIPPLQGVGCVIMVNNGTEPIAVGPDATSQPDTVNPGSTWLQQLPTTGLWGTAFTVNQVSPADTRWDYNPGVQYGHDRLVQGVDASGVKQMLQGLYVHYDVIGPADFGSGSFYVPDAPVVDASPRDPRTAAGTPFTGNLLAHLQEIAESAFIDFFVRPDGVLCWRSFSEVRDQAWDGTTTFGDHAGEIPYSGLNPSSNDANLYNDVQVTLTSDGETTYSASDAASIAAVGRRSYRPSFDVWPQEINAGDPATYVPSSSFHADAFIARYKDPVIHCPQISVDLRALTDAQRMRLLTLPIGYRVRVIRRPPAGDTLTVDCHFEGIQLTWNPGGTNVRCVLNLAPSRAPGTYP